MAGKVLVAGASGLVGAAAVDAFLDDGWEVVAVSRRKPEVFSDRSFQHLPVDLQDEAACKAAFSHIRDVSHIVYTAVYEKPGLIAGWAEQDQMQTNLAMLRNLVEPLSGDAALEHVTLMQGTKAYGIHLHPDRKSTRLNSSHANISYAVFCLKKKNTKHNFRLRIELPRVRQNAHIGRLRHNKLRDLPLHYHDHHSLWRRRLKEVSKDRRSYMV